MRICGWKTVPARPRRRHKLRHSAHSRLGTWAAKRAGVCPFVVAMRVWRTFSRFPCTAEEYFELMLAIPFQERLHVDGLKMSLYLSLIHI